MQIVSIPFYLFFSQISVPKTEISMGLAAANRGVEVVKRSVGLVGPYVYMYTIKMFHLGNISLLYNKAHISHLFCVRAKFNSERE